MKKVIFFGIIFFISLISAFAQTGRTILIEEFSETGCGACAQYDSAFQGLTNANASRVAVINYHCFYALDPFFKYNKTGDQRYSFYEIKGGFPSAMVNGKKPSETSSHLYYVNSSLINTVYDQPPQFNFEVKCSRSGKNNVNLAELNVRTTALLDNLSDHLRLFVVATENNINYKERYHTTSSNGLNDFNHIFRTILPDSNGVVIKPQKKGKVSKSKFSYVNDDKEINFKEVEFVVFIQDMLTKEVLGVTVVKEDISH